MSRGYAPAFSFDGASWKFLGQEPLLLETTGETAFALAIVSIIAGKWKLGD